MDKQYFVSAYQPDWRLDSDYYNFFSDKEKAVAKARSKAWKEGEDMYVYETVVKINKPDLVNTTKVEDIS